MGLTLLHDASLSLSYWPHAFSTAAYLINSQPTPLLNNKSPFEALFHQTPNYLKLKKFGCLCFPLTKPYNTNKLQPKSIPCLFVGYSTTQNAYKCFDLKAEKIYLSQHVLFDESQTHPLLHSDAAKDPRLSISSTPAVPLISMQSLPQPPPVPTRGNAIFTSSLGNCSSSSSSSSFQDMQSLKSCPNFSQSHEHLSSHSNSHTTQVSENTVVHDSHHSDSPLPAPH